MKERTQERTEREIARLRKRNQTKSPVKENVKKFEAKSQSPTPESSRSKSPSVSNQRPNTLFSPTRNKSPGVSSPIRSKSPGVYTPSSNESPSFGSPSRSKSPSVYTPNRSKSPAVDTYQRSKSPGMDTRSKSPGSNTFTRAKSPLATRSKSPGMVSQSPGSSPTKSPGPNTGGSKWSMSNEKRWTKESPVVAETTEDLEGTPDEYLPLVGDTVDFSWYFDNIEYVADSTAPETYTPVVDDVWPGAESPEGSKKIEKRFRNSLNYNITAWDDEERLESDKPKKADEFIQRLCDQVRNQVEYLCGMSFVKYKALSYKVRVAGSEGIFYYVKVSIWQNYCLHLRIFSHKNELKTMPALQAILERAQPDNGNIEFF